MAAILYYVHDPMCAWCWGFRPQWDQLKQALSSQYADRLRIENLTGGLAKDCDQPMAMEMQAAIQGYWRDIATQLNTEFNFDFWTKNQPRRSTFMSCRATIAITHQCDSPSGGRQAQEQMIDAIQRAYYLRALNPSNVSVLAQLAQELGFDAEQFEKDLASDELAMEFNRQLRLARSLPIDGFPSLVLELDGQYHAITRDYHNYSAMLSAIAEYID